MIIEWHESARPEFIPGKGTAQTRFARGAFDRSIGKSVPWTTEDEIIGTAVILEAVVDDDGGGVTFRADFRPDQPLGA